MSVYKIKTEWGLTIWHMRQPYGNRAFKLSQVFVHAPHFWQRWIMRFRGYRPSQINSYWWVKSGCVGWRTLELMAVHDVWFNNPPNRIARAHHLTRMKELDK